MSRIYDSILELIGRTPLVQLHRVEEKLQLQAKLLVKLEYFNPGGSSKDRIALRMVDAAEREGKLTQGGTIIEGTSGNTGIGLAMVAAARGYRAVICMPDNMSKERIQILQGYGAEVELTPASENMAGAGKRASEILEKTEQAVFAGQGSNPNNPEAHYATTGPEIWEDTDGKVDIVVATVGTGGTLTGIAEYLKEKNPAIYVVGVEPAGCPVLSGGIPGPHKIQGIGGGMITPVTRLELFDEILCATDEDAFSYAKLLSRTEGISAGISSGAAIWAAIEVAKRKENEGKWIVTVLPDSGERYLSSGIYD